MMVNGDARGDADSSSPDEERVYSVRPDAPVDIMRQNIEHPPKPGKKLVAAMRAFDEDED